MSTTYFQVHDGLLAIQQTSETNRIRFALEGEMDLANAGTAAAMLQEALASDKDVVVDLTKLELLDSAGVALLVSAMGDGGKRLSFLPSEHESVSRLLSLTGLDREMNLAPRVDISPIVDGAGSEGSESLLPAA